MMSRSAFLVAGLWIAGCGKVGEVPRDASAPDAASMDAAVGDSAPALDAAALPDVPVASCDLSKPFAPATEVPGLHDIAAKDVHGSLTADELTIYFASNRAAPASSTMHIYSATRTSVDVPFGTPSLVGSLFSDQGESNPSVSPDGNTIYFDSFRTMQGTVHIFTSTRTNAAVVFPAATMVAGDFLISPSITADGKVLYAANLQDGGLARLDKVGGGFGTPQSVELATTSSVTAPVSSDDLTLYLSIGDTTGNDIIVTKRVSTAAPFPAPKEVAELKTNSTEAEPSWISPDGCRLYLRYQANGDNSRIYVATRPK